jgi:predicted PurR-regulated permease PerM
MTISPFMHDVIFLLLTFWPALKILGRLGLPRTYAALLLLSLLLPLLGHMLLALVLAVRPWPHFPPLYPNLRPASG